MNYRIELLYRDKKNDPKILNEAYRCWKENWKWVIDNEFKNHAKLDANEFTQQDCVIGLFDGDRCFAVGFVRHIDIQFQGIVDDNWLNQWTSKGVERIKELNNVGICSYNIVDPEYRKNKLSGIGAFDVLSYAMTRAAQSIGIDNVLGMSRNSRGVDKQGSTFGAEAIESGVINPKINEPTNLLLFKKENLDKVVQSLNGSEIERIWLESQSDKSIKTHLKLVA